MIASDFHNDHYHALARVVHAIEFGDQEYAKIKLSDLLESHWSPDRDVTPLQPYLFATALTKRYVSNLPGGTKPCLHDYDEKQTDLFDLVANLFPLASLSKRIANELLFLFIRNRPNVVMIDIGIGSGHQELELIKLLSERQSVPKRLTIIGIEPARDRLRQADRLLSSLGPKYGTELSFIPVQKCVEELTPHEWAEISRLQGDLIVNELFSLNHIRPTTDGSDQKSKVLYHIRELDPVGFVLAEPHSDHESACLSTRFKNAWNHFGLKFRVIDQLDIHEDIKKAIKVKFFGKEIEDILSTSEPIRYERHERAEMWMRRLLDAGFRPKYGPLPVLGGDETVSASWKDSYIGLDFEGDTLVALMSVTGA